MLWIFAAILFVVALALFTFLLWGKLPPIQAGSLALGDLVNLLTALLTMVGLAIALGSFYVAIVAYQKSVKDNAEQQKSLDASRAQLQAVVDAATTQQEILEKNLDTSKAQLNLLEEQWKHEQERQARKPAATVSLGTSDGEKALVDLQHAGNLIFTFEKDQKWGRLQFLVRNTGTTDISKPLIKIYVDPITVFVDGADMRMAERVDHHSFQFDNVRDIEPIQISKMPHSYIVDITVPDAIKSFDIFFAIHGKNLAQQTHKIHFTVPR